jgi:hypothetical protein
MATAKEARVTYVFLRSKAVNRKFWRRQKNYVRQITIVAIRKGGFNPWNNSNVVTFAVQDPASFPISESLVLKDEAGTR